MKRDKLYAILGCAACIMGGSMAHGLKMEIRAEFESLEDTIPDGDTVPDPSVIDDAKEKAVLSLKHQILTKHKTHQVPISEMTADMIEELAELILNKDTSKNNQGREVREESKKKILLELAKTGLVYVKDIEKAGFRHKREIESVTDKKLGDLEDVEDRKSAT